MAYSLETSSVKTIVPGAEVSGFCDVVAREKINELSGEVPQLSAGEGIDISTVDGKTVITNNISAGSNISLVYDMETNTYRIDGQAGGPDPASAVFSQTAQIPTLGLTNYSGVKISGGNEILYYKSITAGNSSAKTSAVSLVGPYVTYLTGTSNSIIEDNLQPLRSEHWNNIITATKEVSDNSWNWNNTFNTVTANSASWASGGNDVTVWSAKRSGGPALEHLTGTSLIFSGGQSFNTLDSVKVVLSSNNKRIDCGWLAPYTSSWALAGNSDILLGWNSLYKMPAWQPISSVTGNIKLLSTGYKSLFPSDASYYYSAMLVDGLVQLRVENRQPGGGAGFGNTGYFSATYTNGGVDFSSVRIFNDTASYPTVTAASSLNWIDCIDVNNTVQTNSASWGQGGHTYTGVAPIQVNNTTDEISITGESLSAGPGIDMFSSGGYVVISSNGGNPFPITGTNGTTGFTANMDCSSMMFTTGASPAGGYVKQTVRGVQYEAYPATDVSASWYNIINAANNINVTCSAVKLTTAASENWFYTSALPNLNEITFIAPSYGPYGTYSALIDDGDTTFVAEVDSGCCRKVVRGWSDDRNKNCWYGLNQENYFYIG